MARQPRTPGATEAPKTTETEVVTTTTADQADAALNEILGTPDATGVASEPVEDTAEDLQAKKEYEEFLAWRSNKATEPVAQHVTGLASSTPKRTRQVCGPKGWTTEEY